jgi:hypothetical protein
MLKNMLVVIAILGLAASSAEAGQPSVVISPNSLGAAVAIPYLTGVEGVGERITVMTVTNGSSWQPIVLHLTWISASDWSSIDYDCPLTPLESTHFVYERFGDSDTAIVNFDCSADGSGPGATSGGESVMRQVPGANGIMFAAVECQRLYCPPVAPGGEGPPPRTLLSNILSADLVVMDFGAGHAFSAPGIHIQGRGQSPAPLARNYEFTGAIGSYAAFPTVLTTNYIAPDDSITAELLLFTLDGKVGSGPGIQAGIAGNAYDDDENPTSGRIRFDCMEVAPIDASPNGWGLNVARTFAGHTAGHLTLYPSKVTRSDEHERSQNNDGLRLAPVHGYLIQTISQGGVFVGGEYGGSMSSSAAWARQLTQGTNPLLTSDGDVPSLDARQGEFDGF